MSIPTKVEINCETGVITEVPLSDDELAQLEIDRKNAETNKMKFEADAKAFEELKASAKAKLISGEKLTEKEASALIN